MPAEVIPWDIVIGDPATLSENRFPVESSLTTPMGRTCSEFPSTDWVRSFIAHYLWPVAHTWTAGEHIDAAGAEVTVTNHPAFTSAKWFDPLDAVGQVDAAYELLFSSFTYRFTQRYSTRLAGFEPGGAVVGLLRGPLEFAFFRGFDAQSVEEEGGLSLPSDQHKILDGSGVDVTIFGATENIKAMWPLAIVLVANSSEAYIPFVADTYNPFVAMNSAANPVRELLFEGSLGVFGKLLVPDPDDRLASSWVWPLNWATATPALPTGFTWDDAGLTEDPFTLPEVAREGLFDEEDATKDLAQSVSEVLESEGMSTAQTVLRVLTVAFGALALTAPVNPLATAIFGLFAAASASAAFAVNSVVGALEVLRTRLKAAASADLRMTVAVATIIFGVKEFLEGVDGLFGGVGGLSASELEQLVQSLAPAGSQSTTIALPLTGEKDVSLWPIVDQPTPITLLSGAEVDFPFFDYETLNFTGEDDLANVLVGEYTLFNHADWLDRAYPTIQFAYEVELAARLLALGMTAESAFCAVPALAALEGTLGYHMKDGLSSSKDMACLAEILDGLSIADLVAFLWKQAVVDNFIQHWLNAATDRDPDCLHEIFCWMRWRSNRDILVQVLGPVAAEADSDGIYWREGGGLLGQLLEQDAAGNTVAGLAGLCGRWEDLVPICVASDRTHVMKPVSSTDLFSTGVSCEGDCFTTTVDVESLREDAAEDLTDELKAAETEAGGDSSSVPDVHPNNVTLDRDDVYSISPCPHTTWKSFLDLLRRDCRTRSQDDSDTRYHWWATETVGLPIQLPAQLAELLPDAQIEQLQMARELTAWETQVLEENYLLRGSVFVYDLPSPLIWETWALQSTPVRVGWYDAAFSRRS